MRAAKDCQLILVRSLDQGGERGATAGLLRPFPPPGAMFYFTGSGPEFGALALGTAFR